MCLRTRGPRRPELDIEEGGYSGAWTLPASHKDLWNHGPKLPLTVPTPALGQNTTATMKEMVPEDEREDADLPKPPGFGPAACIGPGQDKADESGDIPSRLLSIHGSGALATSLECLLRAVGSSSKARTLFL